jgi:hypothetical protein
METVNPRVVSSYPPRRRRRVAGSGLTIALALGVVLACKSGSSSAGPPTLTITPGEATVAAGGPPKQFTATLTNSSAPVGWSIETAGGAAEVGTLSGGLYTPPPALTAAREVVIKAAAAGLVASALVHVMPNSPIPPEPPPDPIAVVTTQAPIAISVMDASTTPPTEITGGFRWIIEENAMRPVFPGQPAVAVASPSLSLHPSYMPVVASGFDGYTTNPPHAVTLDAAKRYFVSVLPNAGYQMGGAAILGTESSVTIYVQRQPIPTAQITIFAFEDNRPINNAPDLPVERGLPGFTVLLTEAGGTYGQSGGQVTQDAFGNPIGTEYQKNPDGSFVLDADGNPAVQSMGTGSIYTDANGLARVKYVPPAKYTVQLIPPRGEDWHQTTTIEGTPGIDAWVAAKEPPFLQEFGPPMQHVFMGFVHTTEDAQALNGSATIRGRVVNLHVSRPPSLAANPGAPLPGCWIGLNASAGAGQGIYAKPCNPDSTFAIPNVPPGVYQLVVWDEFLDLIINFSLVTVAAGDVDVNAGDVLVNQWFARMEGKVCLDLNENGFCDPGEVGIPDQALNLRFRDGSIYQSTATDQNGEYAFSELFPFFNWFIAEVDFLRFKATGATIVVDGGGAIPPANGWTTPSRGKLTPQPQFDVDPATGFATGTPLVNPNTGNNLSRTETGPVLLEGFQAFAGLTNVIEWGKSFYGPGQNGGITGIVHYASTRAENDPRYAAADNWEPKIPRVPVFLYVDCEGDGRIDPVDCTSLSSAGYAGILGDVDNWPFGWSDGSAPMGPEDVKRSTRGDATVFDAGDAYDFAATDSFDDSPPSGCQYDPATGPFRDASGTPVDCFEGMPNFNQVRPAVFDGGYAFGSAAGKPELPVGTYIVEAVTPPGYEHVKEEDKNVDFGDAYVPSPLLLPPPCVGPRRLVPAELALFPGIPTAFPGQITNLCDRKQVVVKQGENGAADFFMFTTVPVTAHVVALVTDDLNNGINAASPLFGEKLALGHIPISIHDWAGVEIGRTYTDQWGIAEMLVPSTFSANVPMPSGYSPNMLRACVNSPGRVDPATGAFTPDPFHDRTHSHTCYTLQYMPGKTTYLDTPVVPVSAFATQAAFPVDCELEDGVPIIRTVEGRPAGGGSYDGPRVPVVAGGTAAADQPRVVITSVGSLAVPNPAFNGTNAATIVRNYGFGAGTGSVTLNGTDLPIVSWADDVVVTRVPPGSTTGQLELVRGDGRRTVMGVTLTVSDAAPLVVGPGGVFASIQAAIDAAADGQLVLVKPGAYRELLVMHKKVQLQGWGAPSTVIDGTKVITGLELQVWRDKLTALVAAGAFDLLPGQAAGTLLALEEGPAVLVAGNAGEFTEADRARVDGFTITGASEGGGVLVNGYARYAQVSNNDIVHNTGTFGGGIRVGHPTLVNPATNDYTDADNDFVVIRNNHVALNGGMGGSGGIALSTGADDYVVEANYVCGNYSNGNGGGIGHLGLSRNGTIRGNTVRFNQAYMQGQISEGGGILVAGQQAFVAGPLSPGTGSVRIVANLVQGNHGATGDGGGIRLQLVNGQDVLAAPNDPAAWYEATLEDNVVVDNVAGGAGGGISLQDVVRSRIFNNTVANNDSTATSIVAFAGGSPNQSAPQPAGIVSWVHSGALFAAIGAGAPAELRTPYSNPALANNIVWHNRSFFWTVDPIALTQGLAPDIGAGQPAVHWDLAVLGAGAAQLDPQFCLLTDPTGYAPSNFTGDPLFVSEYFNGDRAGTPGTSMTTFAAFDEGGNFLSLEFGPLTPRGDYHVQPGSPALGAGGGSPVSATDFDGQTRPIGQPTPDVGADER